MFAKSNQFLDGSRRQRGMVGHELREEANTRAPVPSCALVDRTTEVSMLAGHSLAEASTLRGRKVRCT